MMVAGSSPVTLNCVAVDMVELEVALKYHMLFVPPVALNAMGMLTQLDSMVPAFCGALGRS